MKKGESEESHFKALGLDAQAWNLFHSMISGETSGVLLMGLYSWQEIGQLCNNPFDQRYLARMMDSAGAAREVRGIAKNSLRNSSVEVPALAEYFVRVVALLCRHNESFPPTASTAHWWALIGLGLAECETWEPLLFQAQQRAIERKWLNAIPLVGDPYKEFELSLTAKGRRLSE